MFEEEKTDDEASPPVMRETERSEALEQQFEVGEEIVTYRQVEELEEKVRHYLDNPDEARAIADRGMAAVRDRHTMRLRIQHMLAGAGRSG